MSLEYLARQLTIYVGCILLITGIVGNGMNIFIFSSVRSYRRTPCTFYFLVCSIHNILYILINLPVRIASTALNIDLNIHSLVWCRVQSFFIGYLGLTSFTLSCLTTIDQFFATSRSAWLRRCSKIQWAHRIVLAVIIVWCLHGIPVLVLFNIPPVTSRCSSDNPAYAFYTTIYILLLQSCIPSIVMVIFGYLTYRNIARTIVLAEQQADRQFVKMILIQVVLVVISMTPYGTDTIYRLITSKVIKSPNRLLKESFASTILILITYFYYVVCFILSKINSNIVSSFILREIFICS
jgi:hypothetical protein